MSGGGFQGANLGRACRRTEAVMGAVGGCGRPARDSGQVGAADQRHAVHREKPGRHRISSYKASHRISVHPLKDTPLRSMRSLVLDGVAQKHDKAPESCAEC